MFLKLDEVLYETCSLICKRGNFRALASVHHQPRATLNEFAGLKNFAGGLPGGPLVILLVELVIVNFLHFCSKLLKNKYVQWTQLIESCPEMVFLGHIYRYHRNSSSIWAQFGPIWLDLTGCLGEVTNKIGGAIFSSKLKRKLFFEVPL